MVPSGNKKLSITQAKCLNWIREEYALLAEQEKDSVKTFLDGTNCEQIF